MARRIAFGRSGDVEELIDPHRRHRRRRGAGHTPAGASTGGAVGPPYHQRGGMREAGAEVGHALLQKPIFPRGSRTSPTARHEEGPGHLPQRAHAPCSASMRATWQSFAWAPASFCVACHVSGIIPPLGWRWCAARGRRRPTR